MKKTPARRLARLLLIAAVAVPVLGGCKKKDEPVNRGNPPPTAKVLEVERSADLGEMHATLVFTNSSAEDCKISRFSVKLPTGRLERVTPKGFYVPANGTAERRIVVRGINRPIESKLAQKLETSVLARCGKSAR